jgi:hypothetical protein
MDKINQIKALLGMEIKLENAKLDNGTVLEAESFEAGKEIFIKSEEEDIALPKGEYNMEDGKVLVVEEDGIISAMKDKEEEPKEEDVEEQEMEAEVEAPQAKKVVESVSKETHFAKVEELEALRKEVEELKLALQPKEEPKEEVELSEEVPPIKHNPEGEADKKEMFLYSQKAPKTTKSIIYNKLFNK